MNEKPTFLLLILGVIIIRYIILTLFSKGEDAARNAGLKVKDITAVQEELAEKYKGVKSARDEEDNYWIDD